MIASFRRARFCAFACGASLGTLFAAEVPAVIATADAVSPAGTPAPTGPVSPPKLENGYLRLSFEHLASFVFVPPVVDEKTTPDAVAKSAAEQIPAPIKSWSGKKAAVMGFMIPVRMEKGLVTEFLLMRNQLACCFGATPNINEWIVAKMKKGGIPATMDVPVEFFGELKVSPIFENGYISGLYQLDCERMGDVKN